MRDAFMHHYYAFVYVRIMQALGAYGFRGFYERKPHFLQSVPYAVKNLRWLLNNATLPIALPALTSAFKGIVDSVNCWLWWPKATGVAAPRHQTSRKSQCPQPRPTTGRPDFSFSFHRGGPPKTRPDTAADLFSMRAACPIPDAKKRFKVLTGKDAPVDRLFAAAQKRG